MGAALSDLEQLYRDRIAEFRRVATAIAGDVERGRDAVQEAFATAVRRRAAFRGDGPLEAWLWRIVVNHARDEARRPRALPVAAPLETQNGRHDDDGRLAAAIATLTERQRLVLFLRYYADLDYATIARALAISSGTVAASLNTIHAALRRRLEEVHR